MVGVSLMRVQGYSSTGGKEIRRMCWLDAEPQRRRDPIAGAIEAAAKDATKCVIWHSHRVSVLFEPSCFFVASWFLL
jgi:hypothetical protein